MTDTSSDTTPAEETTADTEAPVRVPNVSPQAVSGLLHEPLGSNTQAAYDANQDLADGDAWTEVPGQTGEVDNPGEAVNAETGEVTAPGDSLPPIEQTDGTPLDPADGTQPEDTAPADGQDATPAPASGDDSTDPGPEPTGDRNGPETGSSDPA